MDEATKKLIKKIDDSGEIGILRDLYDLFILELIQGHRVMELIETNASRIPKDLILAYWEACEWDIAELESNLELAGFNDWYKETYGVTVKEASHG